MKSINIFIVATLSIFLTTSCTSIKTRNTASVKQTYEPQDAAMVNVISSSRMPASATNSLELGSTNTDVNVSAQLIKLPGDSLQHAQLIFTVKDHPEIAGQITGNSGGSELSVKFTTIIKKIMKDGVSEKTSSVITTTQNKFNKISQLSADQREAAIRSALLEARDQLVALY